MTSSTFSSPPPLDCTAVDACLAEYLDDEPPTTLSADQRVAVDRHVAACARCRPLVRDLRAIGDAAATLPALAPSRDLWADIAPRLAPRVTTGATTGPTPEAATDDGAARVLPFAVRHVRHAPPAAGRRGAAPVAWPRQWLAAAAVALMAVSAGTTYLITRASDASAPAASQLAVTPAGTDHGGESRTTATPVAPGAVSETAVEPADVRQASTADDAAPRRSRGDAARFVSRSAAPDLEVVAPAASAYDREIATLRAAVRDRRGELDSATVTVLVRNLGIIDAAIAQSRAALARDPHSQFLGDQLTRALGQKVELLRTVALMPRT